MTIEDAPMVDLINFYRNGFAANTLTPLGDRELQMMRAVNAEIMRRKEMEVEH